MNKNIFTVANPPKPAPLKYRDLRAGDYFVFVDSSGVPLKDPLVLLKLADTGLAVTGKAVKLNGCFAGEVVGWASDTDVRRVFVNVTVHISD